MSYANGINSLQHAISSITSSEARPAIQANSSDKVTNQTVEPIVNVEHADQTNLSSAAGLVAQALEGSDTRSERVTSLQQAIAAGNYSVSSSDVADKIIQTLLD